MAEISRYVLVDKSDNEADYEYDTYQEAVDACDVDHAVIERHYVYDDSELVYTPDGSDSWPPREASRIR